MAVLAICAMSCRDDPHIATLKSMHERTVKLTRESIDLREKLKKSEQIQASMMEDAKRSRESLKLAELNVMTQPARPYVPATAPAVEPATSDRRGGFTDFGDSVTQAPPISQAPTGRSSTVAAIPQRASSPSNDPRILSYCTGEWPGNYRMQAYCAEAHQQAKTKVVGRTRSSTGMWPNEFEAMREGCTTEWPGNVKMQNYCEEQQVAAYQRLKQ